MRIESDAGGTSRCLSHCTIRTLTVSGAKEKYVKPGGCLCVAAWGTNFWENPENTCTEDLLCVYETYFTCIAHLHYRFRTTSVDGAPILFVQWVQILLKPVLLQNTES
jgi:hypothetical protein